jgi:hypothetical protein
MVALSPEFVREEKTDLQRLAVNVLSPMMVVLIYGSVHQTTPTICIHLLLA